MSEKKQTSKEKLNSLETSLKEVREALKQHADVINRIITAMDRQANVLNLLTEINKEELNTLVAKLNEEKEKAKQEELAE